MAVGRDILPRTRPGRDAASVGGYLSHRILDWGRSRLSRVRSLEAHTLYDVECVDMEANQGRVSFHPFAHPSDPAERQQAFLRAHGPRLQWADQFSQDRLGLHTPTGQSTYRSSVEALTALNLEYRRRFAATQATWHTRRPSHEDFVAMGPASLERWRETRGLIHQAERVEHRWQEHGYIDLRDRALGPRRTPRALERAFGTYRERVAAYEATLTRMEGEARGAYEYLRKQAEEEVFLALWNLHRATQQLYGGPDQVPPGLAAPLTFSARTQAHAIALGPNGMAGMEPFVERPFSVMTLVRQLKAGQITLEEFDRLVPARAAIPFLLDQFTRVRLGVPHEMMAEGVADRLISSGMSPFAEPLFPQGMFALGTHTGVSEGPGLYTLFDALHMPPPGIVYEGIFGHLPAMKEILAIHGLSLSRFKQGSPVAYREAKELRHRAMAELMSQGVTVTLMMTGTRALGWPLVSPYAPLAAPGVFHLPGEFMPSRDATGGDLRAARYALEGDYDVPIGIFPQNLHRAGFGEPSLSRRLWRLFSPYSIFHYSHPQTDEGWIAFAGYLRASDLITSRDFPLANDWTVAQMNIALLREMEMRTGFHMDAGPS